MKTNHAAYISKIVSAVCVVVSLYFSISLSQGGFTDIQNFKQLERLVPTRLIGVLDGPVQIHGEADILDDGLYLTSPHAKVTSLYYRFLEERESRDSDGNTSWVTVKDTRDAVDFYISDDSGESGIRVEHALEQIQWSMPSSYHVRRGDRRYTEWRIEPGDQLTIFGYAQVNSAVDNEPDIDIYFTGDHSVLPVISKLDSETVRGKLGLSAVFKIWGGVSLLALCIFCLLYFLQIHRILAFLTLITCITSLSLFSYGLSSLSKDTRTGYELIQKQHAQAKPVIEALSERTHEAWIAQRVSEIKTNLALSEFIYEQQTKVFPESLYVSLFGLSIKPNIQALSESERHKVKQALNDFQKTNIKDSNGTLWVLLSLAVFIGLTFVGFRYAKVKRQIENIPTTKTRGVTYGLAEVKGRITPIEDDQLESPLSYSKCVWYRYLVEEKRGSGKKSKWVKISDDTEHLPFYCQDHEGVLRINPKDAEVITEHKKTERTGKMRYTEWTLRLRDKLYALGKADIDSQHAAAELTLTQDEEEKLFILSNLSENQVMLRKASKAMLALLFAYSALFFSAVFFHGLSGHFSATDYLASSLIAPIFLIFFILVMHYNDLIFLKRRADRNWANIQVSLKKRRDLLPNIEKVIKKYLEHEQSLLTELSDLRQTVKSDLNKAEDTHHYLSHESKVIDELNVSIEAYPDLKSDALMQGYMKSLQAMENEVSLMREGFNDAVSYYNTRIESFPDIIFAKTFGFHRKSLLDYTE